MLESSVQVAGASCYSGDRSSGLCPSFPDRPSFSRMGTQNSRGQTFSVNEAVRLGLNLGAKAFDKGKLAQTKN